jgi:PleD family two-component response regulator
MLVADIDRFKEYNHQYRHQRGEQSVRDTAESIIQGASQLSLAHAGRHTAYLTASAGPVVKQPALGASTTD